MPEQNRDSALSTIAVLALCALFFILAMGITLLGSNIYRNVNAAADKNYHSRTSLSYVVNQVRRNDCGKIVLGTFDGHQALMLFESEDNPYATLLYCYEGQLMELYLEAEFLDEFYAEDGIPMMELSSLSMSLEGTLLSIVSDGKTVVISPRCQIEEVGAL